MPRTTKKTTATAMPRSHAFIRCLLSFVRSWKRHCNQPCPASLRIGRSRRDFECPRTDRYVKQQPMCGPRAAPEFVSWEIDMPGEVAGQPITATEQVYATRAVGEV